MDIESIVGVIYCVIGFVHFVFQIRKDLKRRYYSEPMELVAAMFAWPLVDVLWLISRKRCREKSDR